MYHNLQLKQTRFINARKELREQNRIRVNFEKSMQRKLIIMFNEFGNKGAKIYESTGTTGLTLYFSQTRKKVEQTLKPFYIRIIQTFSERLERRLTKKEGNFFDILTERYMMSVGANHITDIDATTRKQLQRVISQAQKEGLGVAQTARQIEERFQPRFTRARSATIARTETHSAASFANHEMGKELQSSGVQLKKQWVATSDERTRIAHINANGTTVPMDEAFVVDGASMQYTGDPNGGARNVINCRCVTLYIEDETVVYDSPTVNTTTKLPPVKDRFVGFGETNPDELEWHNSSWDNSPLDIKNLISLFPPLVKVDRTTGRGAYAHRVFTDKPIHMYEKKDKGNVFIHMRGAKGDDEIKNKYRQDVWRHEYGHAMDMQMITILNKKPKLSKYNEIQLAPDRTFGDELYSANFAEEILEDRKALAQKFRKQPTYDEIKEGWYQNAETLKKEGFLTSKTKFDDVPDRRLIYNDYIPTEKRIDEAFLDKYLTDGKIFTKEELKAIIYSNEGKEKIFKKSRVSGGKLNQAHIANRILRINYANKTGFIKGETEGIFREMQELAIMTDNSLTGNQIGILADYLGAITNEAIGFGHGKGYYSSFPSLARGVSTGHGTEAFANFISFAGDETLTKIYKPIIDRYAPKTQAQFDKGIKDLQEQVK
tara:strand:+ start:16 stop:1992 length:1977 start_codon:yes stop_codon:yes gene_type:complete